MALGRNLCTLQPQACCRATPKKERCRARREGTFWNQVPGQEDWQRSCHSRARDGKSRSRNSQLMAVPANSRRPPPFLPVFSVVKKLAECLSRWGTREGTEAEAGSKLLGAHGRRERAGTRARGLGPEVHHYALGHAPGLWKCGT